jgi:hypothetical protein
MKHLRGIVVGVVVAAVLGVVAAAATATNGPPSTGHDPVTVCHKPGTPAQQTLTFDDDGYEAHLAHGDTAGACEPLPPGECEETSGEQQYGEECPPPPPVDVCENLPGNQPEGTDCTPTTPPVVTPPTHDCVFVGADKDGGKDAFGGTNDDCAPRPTPPTVTTTVVVPPAVVVPVTPPTVVTPPTNPGVVSKPPSKPKAKKTPKPKKVVRHDKAVPKPDDPHVCRTLADGTERRWFAGNKTTPAGCYAIVRGSG